MKNYKIGFSVKGFISFILVMIPNIIWAVAPPAVDILSQNNAVYPVFDWIMNICRFIIVALLVLLINIAGNTKKRTWLFVAPGLLCLFGYCISWGLYYGGNVNPWLFVAGLAAAPSLYFIFVGLWLKNYLSLLPSVLFAVIHITVTYLNFA